MLRVHLETVTIKGCQFPGLFVFPWSQAGQVFCVTLVHVWKACCAISGRCLLLALASSLWVNALAMLLSVRPGPLHREKDSEGHDDLPNAEAAALWRLQM